MPKPAALSPDELRTVYPSATVRSQRKELDHLDRHCVRFIGLSPFCVLGSVGPGGGPDLSPRGGEPGFARVLDAHTLVLPDRPGNYRLDNLSNVAARSLVALLFMVPGVDETLRVYGNAGVHLLDQETRTALALDQKGRTALYIDVTKAFFHCAKALMRSHLWDPAAQIERSEFPSMGELMSEHSQLPGPVETQTEMLARYQPTL